MNQSVSKPTHRNNHTTSNAIRSKHRLADISHHFLSNENERLPAWENTTVIPVLLGSKTDDYVVYELNHAFNQQKNNSSMVLNIENRLSSRNDLSAHENEVDNDDGGLPDYCLIPASSPSTTLALQSDRLIIAVHASLSGVRIAYDQLSFMASLNTDFNVCVIMLDAKTITSAKRFFGFLCDSAQSLLSLKLECGGYLLQDGEHIPAESMEEAEIENEDVATDMKGVAASLLHRFTLRTKASTAHLVAPANPAALLLNRPFYRLD